MMTYGQWQRAVCEGVQARGLACSPADFPAGLLKRWYAQANKLAIDIERAEAHLHNERRSADLRRARMSSNTYNRG